MQERQKEIAAWMRAVIDRRGISARAWAEAAKMGKDTVSRALREDYESITTTRTIAKLAEAIDETPPGIAAAIPSEASLAEILEIFLRTIAPDRMPDNDSLLAFAGGLRETLLQLADEPVARNDPKASRLAARMTARRMFPGVVVH